MRLLMILMAIFWSVPSLAYFQKKMMKANSGAQRPVDPNHWTLAGWLMQKRKVAFMDMWLAMNTQAQWFEFLPRVGQWSFEETSDVGGVKATSRGNVKSTSADMYISILNFHGEYENRADTREEYGGALGLRLLGTSAQSTNLVARYGWRKLQDLDTREVWENQYVEGDLQLYIFDGFGLEGQYRHFFPNLSNQGSRFEGYRVTTGAYLEWMIFRLYGRYIQEPVETLSGGVLTKTERKGWDFGLRLAF